MDRDGRIASHLRNALAVAGLAAVACIPQSAIATPRDPGSAGTAASVSGDAMDAAVYALGLVGVAYRDGGDSPERGFDCSGLTRHVLARMGVADLPRTAREQGAIGRPVPRSVLRTGDLVFFDTQGSAYSHVGIYVGDGRFVHAPGRGKSVTLATLDSPYWQRHYNGARRYSADEATGFAWGGSTRTPPEGPSPTSAQAKTPWSLSGHLDLSQYEQ